MASSNKPDGKPDQQVSGIRCFCGGCYKDPIWADGGIDSADADQSQALEALAAAEMVTRGDLIDVHHDNVANSLRTLSEPSPPTDTPHVADY